MNRTQRLITTVLSTTAVLLGGLSIASPAQAVGSPNCVTRSEFLGLRVGQTQARVNQITGVAGQTVSIPGDPGPYVRMLPLCSEGWDMYTLLEFTRHTGSPATLARKAWNTDTPGCVSLQEEDRLESIRYSDRSIDLDQVTYLMDTAGWQISLRTGFDYDMQVRGYRMCSGHRVLPVYYIREHGQSSWRTTVGD